MAQIVRIEYPGGSVWVPGTFGLVGTRSCVNESKLGLIRDKPLSPSYKPYDREREERKERKEEKRRKEERKGDSGPNFTGFDSRSLDFIPEVNIYLLYSFECVSHIIVGKLDKFWVRTLKINLGNLSLSLQIDVL